ncbi:MAG: hypothetical protein AAF235_00750 [Planctomycetota bacterium]
MVPDVLLCVLSVSIASAGSSAICGLDEFDQWEHSMLRGRFAQAASIAEGAEASGSGS